MFLKCQVPLVPHRHVGKQLVLVRCSCILQFFREDFISPRICCSFFWIFPYRWLWFEGQRQLCLFLSDLCSSHFIVLLFDLVFPVPYWKLMGDCSCLILDLQKKFLIFSPLMLFNANVGFVNVIHQMEEIPLYCCFDENIYYG